jgi:hypothetical protein
MVRNYGFNAKILYYEICYERSTSNWAYVRFWEFVIVREFKT